MRQVRGIHRRFATACWGAQIRIDAMKNIVLLALLIYAGWYGYDQYLRRARAPVEVPVEAATPVVPSSAPSSGFKCDGRIYCSQMTSCAEATFFLQHCPGTRMDGNNDGVPCEKQWCR